MEQRLLKHSPSYRALFKAENTPQAIAGEINNLTRQVHDLSAQLKEATTNLPMFPGSRIADVQEIRDRIKMKTEELTRLGDYMDQINATPGRVLKWNPATNSFQ